MSKVYPKKELQLGNPKPCAMIAAVKFHKDITLLSRNEVNTILPYFVLGAKLKQD